jgi:hypothetical protein
VTVFLCDESSKNSIEPRHLLLWWHVHPLIAGSMA